jgi:Flp pilus assembly protein protease CpaA
MASGVIFAAVFYPERLLILGITFIALMVLFLLNGIGGADVKVLTALAGLWPAAMIAALVVQGTWGLLVLIRKGKGVEFKAIPAYALGASLSALLLL